MLSVTGVIVLVLGIGCGAYYAYSTHKALKAAEQELAARTAAFQIQAGDFRLLIAELRQENEDMAGTLTEEQKANVDLEREKRKNETQIDTLTKLTTLDPELLKKYSKVYFLSENYAPPALADIDPAYRIDPAKPLQVLDQVAPFLNKLLAAAARDGVDLRVLSAYRSFQTQMQLKSGYVVQYGTGANAFSAEQGYSEHQLGTAVDFTTQTVKGAYLSFENTPAYQWLTKHANEFGFILSYPKGNRYYIYEPWHWRFVGRDLADHLHDEGKYFYDLDQRTIDQYLLTIFD